MPSPGYIFSTLKKEALGYCSQLHRHIAHILIFIYCFTFNLYNYAVLNVGTYVGFGFYDAAWRSTLFKRAYTIYIKIKLVSGTSGFLVLCIYIYMIKILHKNLYYEKEPTDVWHWVIVWDWRAGNKHFDMCNMSVRLPEQSLPDLKQGWCTFLKTFPRKSWTWVE